MAALDPAIQILLKYPGFLTPDGRIECGHGDRRRFQFK
jgi:hypothetical protein